MRLTVALVFHTTRAPPSFLRLSAHGLGCAAAAAPTYHGSLIIRRGFFYSADVYFQVLTAPFLFSVLPRLGSAAHSSKKGAILFTPAFNGLIFGII